MYELLFAEVVKKQQSTVPKKDMGKIKALILGLAENPRPLKCKKLSGSDNAYRVRQGVWRVLYEVDDRKKQVVVYGILHRKEAYR
jgi:mRNA interferase RelE/StbE